MMSESSTDAAVPVYYPSSLSPAAAQLVPPALSDLSQTWIIDKVTAVVWTPSAHPGTFPADEAYRRATAAVAASGGRLKLGRMGRSRKTLNQNHIVTYKRGPLKIRQLSGPGSYAALISSSSIRTVRQFLEAVDTFQPYEPSSDDPRGNFIRPSAYTVFRDQQLTEMCRSEAAQRLLSLPEVYEISLKEILGIQARVSPSVSLTGMEIAWDIMTDEPDSVLRSFSEACVKNLHDLSEDRLAGMTPDAHSIAGACPLFHFSAYLKRPAESGLPGIIRLEFRFHKAGILSLLKTNVLPTTLAGVETVVCRLGAEASRYMLAIEQDRIAPRSFIQPAALLPAICGFRRHSMVDIVLSQIARTGKARVTAVARRFLARLEKAQIVTRLLFSRPAYRKLRPGIDMSAWLGIPKASKHE